MVLDWPGAGMWVSIHLIKKYCSSTFMDETMLTLSIQFAQNGKVSHRVHSLVEKRTNC